MEKTYEDLPEWAQPGQKAVHYSSAEARLVTVQRATRTQIVAITKWGNEVRFERTPVGEDKYSPQKWQDVRFRQRSADTYFAYLVSPEEPYAARSLIHQAAKGAVQSVQDRCEALVRERRNPDKADKRSAVERAFDELDAIENAVRVARKRLTEKIDKYGAVLAND